MDRIRELQGGMGRLNQLQDTIVDTYIRPHSVTAACYCYGFVFLYFGIQKPAPVTSPVRQEVGVFAAQFGLPTTETLLFIGLYEMLLGVLFFTKRIRLVFWPFFAHQLLGFIVLVTIPYTVFQPPWLTIHGIDLPWALGGFSAFVMKNVVFIGGFLVLVSATLGSENPPPAEPNE